MQNIFKVNNIILLLLVTLSWPAAADNAAVETLVALLGQTDTLRADVQQLTLDQNGREVQETRARLVMRKPDHFWWQTTFPYEERMVTDGDKVWLYEPDLEQVTIQDFSHELDRTPALLLSGDAETLAGNFRVTLSDGAQDGYRRFVLHPVADDSLFTRLSLTFEGPVLREMQFEDSLGQKTSLTFSNLERNVTVDESRFRFEPPPGVDVIDSSAGD